MPTAAVHHTSPAADSADASGPPLRLDVSAVQLENVQLRVRDEMAKLAGEITLHSFSSGRLAKQGEAPVTLRASLNLTQPQALKLALDGRTNMRVIVTMAGGPPGCDAVDQLPPVGQHDRLDAQLWVEPAAKAGRSHTRKAR